MNKKYLALLGFLPAVEKQLKDIIEKSIYEDIEWVSATADNLQGVAINASFLNSPQIKKYMDKISASVVSCYREPDGEKNAKATKIPTLNLQNYAPMDLQAWLLELTNGALFSSAFQKTYEEYYVKQQLTDVAAFTDQTPSEQRIKNTNKSVLDASNHALSDNYWALLENLQKPGNYLYTFSKKSETWVDTQKNIAYINYNRDNTPKINQQHWKECDALGYDEHFRRVQLDLWLFECIWASNITIDNYSIPSDTAYRLVRWPRPLSSRGRSEVLRLAAFAQSSPVTITDLQQKTGYSEKIIRRFLFAALAAKQIKVANTMVGIVDTPAPSPSQAPDTEKLNLVDRLRSKLGLN